MLDLPLFRLELGYGEDYARRFLIENGAEPFLGREPIERSSLAYVFPDSVKRRTFSHNKLADRPLPQLAISNSPLTLEAFDRFAGDFSSPGLLYLAYGSFDLYNLQSGFLGSVKSERKPFVLHDDHAYTIPAQEATKWFVPDGLAERVNDPSRTIN